MLLVRSPSNNLLTPGIWFSGGGYLAAATTNITRPYFEEYLTKQSNEKGARLLLDLAPLLLVGGTSYFVQRSLKVATIAGVYFAAICRLINTYNRHVVMNECRTDGSLQTTYYQKLAQTELKEKSEKKFTSFWNVELELERLLVNIARGNIDQVKDYKAAYDKKTNPWPERKEGELLQAHIDGLIKNGSQVEALKILKEEVEDLRRMLLPTNNSKYINPANTLVYSVLNRARAVISGYLKLKDNKQLGSFLKDLTEIYQSFENLSLRADQTHLSALYFTIAEGHFFIDQSNDALLLLNNPKIQTFVNYPNEVIGLIDRVKHHLADSAVPALQVLQKITYNYTPGWKKINQHLMNHIGKPDQMEPLYWVNAMIKQQTPCDQIAILIERDRTKDGLQLVSMEYVSAYVDLAKASKNEAFLTTAQEIYEKLKKIGSQEASPLVLAQGYLHCRQVEKAYQLCRSKDEMIELQKYHYSIDAIGAGQKTFADWSQPDRLKSAFMVANDLRTQGQIEIALDVINTALNPQSSGK